ncbi:long-chain-fatty-acid--CoA ligase ACSBG2 [Alligator mississippiensis]|uniref:long-chain-fatty-acid--CoA ligase ACSBG2 n=1 Tax=Alligator mississippiensis TaxID=8496 RepID=UPI002877B92A|nr:long-chain-fatty-acid--CoA ligase ACSBG2 [Alligator mississippiensis]
MVGGKNIAPVPIEDACQVDLESGVSLDELSPKAMWFCRELGSQATQMVEVLSTRDLAVYQTIQQGVQWVNQRTLSHTHRVQKWALLPRDFSIASGERRCPGTAQWSRGQSRPQPQPDPQQVQVQPRRPETGSGEPERGTWAEERAVPGMAQLVTVPPSTQPVPPSSEPEGAAQPLTITSADGLGTAGPGRALAPGGQPGMAVQEPDAGSGRPSAQAEEPPPNLLPAQAYCWGSPQCRGESDQVAPAPPPGILMSVAGAHDRPALLPAGGCSGPVAPAETLFTTRADGAVRLRLDPEGPGALPPITVHQLFQEAVKRHGDRPALAYKRGQTWESLSYRQYQQQCRAAAKGFLKLGLERFHGVAILGSNSPEWVIADIGAIMAGGLAVGIYSTSSPEACGYVAANCAANVVVVEDNAQLSKILQVQKQLSHLKAIVQYRDPLEEKRPNVYTWEEFMELGRTVPDSQLDSIICSQCVNHCCTLIYTSGTTGTPKGVMLSHDNVMWEAKMLKEVLGLQVHEVFVSYLPLSHVAAQLFDLWLPMCVGGTTFFAQPNALKGSLLLTLKEVRPTFLFAVPRVWEKMEEKLKATFSQSSLVKRKLVEWARGIGLQASYSRLDGDGSVPWGFALAERLVFRKVREELGLQRCTLLMTGAAPISKDTLEFFMSLHLPLLDMFGLSETNGPYSTCTPQSCRILSCGKELPGCRSRIEEPDAEGTGELCCWGRHVFMGYLGMEALTREALDEEGWLHTGDLVRRDPDGFLYIMGRIKELVITVGGKNIAPVPIEDAVKREVPIVSNAVLVGDCRRFLAMLLTLKCKVDPESGAPLDELSPEAVQFCQEVGSRATRVSEVLSTRDPAVYQAIQLGVERVNQHAPSHAHYIQKWALLPRDFSIIGGELGPTAKVKRQAVLSTYKDVIGGCYQD